MKINLNLNPVFNNKINSKQNNNKQNTLQYFAYNTNYAKLPQTKDYLAFLGGYSLNLRETFENLSDEDYPFDMKQRVQEALLSPCDKKLTLKDIHNERFGGILDCYSLDELKQKYPEFQDVHSAYEVEATPDSFIGRFQNNELELFPNDEDLTLQLIKLYWGKGLSYNGISDYIKENSSDNSGKKLRYAMQEKLNIPPAGGRYKQVLGLSDEEQNRIFIEKIKEAKERRLQQSENEPVYIPKGPLSEAHRRHISEGLKNYYLNNPDSIYLMSKRQIEYYENHPEEKERLSEVLDYAWNVTHEGKTVKKHLSKFARKLTKEQKLDGELVLQDEMSKETQNLLKEFWKRNSWAKEKWSIAMQKGFKYHTASAMEYLDGKTKPGEKICFSVVPTLVVEDMKKFAKTINFDVKKYDVGLSYIDNSGKTPEKKVIDYAKNIDAFVDKYQDSHPVVKNRVIDARLNSIIKFKDDLEQNSRNLPKSLRKDDIKRYRMNFILEKLFLEDPVYTINPDGTKQPNAGVPSNAIIRIITTIMMQALHDEMYDIPEYFKNLIDKSYEELLQINYIGLNLPTNN